MIRGKVVDEKENPLAGVKITFYDPPTGLNSPSRPTKGGRFLRKGIYPATYEITFQLEW